MSEERCIPHDMILSGCADCTGRDGGVTAERKRNRRLLDMPYIVPAAYTGHCAVCGEFYGVGAPIKAAPATTRTTDVGTSWAGPCCLNDDGSVRRATD